MESIGRAFRFNQKTLLYIAKLVVDKLVASGKSAKLLYHPKKEADLSFFELAEQLGRSSYVYGFSSDTDWTCNPWVLGLLTSAAGRVRLVKTAGLQSVFELPLSWAVLIKHVCGSDNQPKKSGIVSLY